LRNPKKKICLKNQLLNKSPNNFEDGFMNNDAKNLHQIPMIKENKESYSAHNVDEATCTCLVEFHTIGQKIYGSS